jgi:hypothetical protein
MVDLPAPERPTRPIFSPGGCAGQVLDDAALLAVVEGDVFEADVALAATASGLAPGGRSPMRGSEIELMPSRTVPMFSNSCDISHMIHWLMPWKRMTSADGDGDRAGVIASCSHSQMPSAPMANSSAVERVDADR